MPIPELDLVQFSSLFIMGVLLSMFIGHKQRKPEKIALFFVILFFTCAGIHGAFIITLICLRFLFGNLPTWVNDFVRYSLNFIGAFCITRTIDNENEN